MQTKHTQTAQTTRQNTLSANPNKALQEVIETIQTMRHVYEQETQALERLDTKTFLGLQEQKLETTQIYKSRIEEILRRRDEMKSADHKFKRDLERMQAEFATLSAKNMTALKRMRRTMDRLGETIQRIVKESANTDRAFSYGESGKLESQERKSVSIGVSETA